MKTGDTNKDATIIVSSFAEGLNAESARLGDNELWSPLESEDPSYVAMEFSEKRVVTAVVIKGDGTRREIRFTVQYRLDVNDEYTTLTDAAGNPRVG